MGVASRRCARCRVAEAQWDGLDCVVVNLLLMHGCGGSVVNRGRLTVWESHDLAQIQQILICCDQCQIEDLCRCRQEPVCWVSVGRWSQMSEQIRSLLLSQTGFFRCQANTEPSIDRFYPHRQPGR